jgi:signal transduction histidine kinase
MNTSLPRSQRGADSRLARLLSEVRSLRTQLRHAQRLSTVGTMAAMVAHEFNNILTPIVNYAQLAQDGDELMRTKAIAHAYEGANRAATICRALLDVAARGDERLARVNLAELIDKTLTAMARDLAKDGINLIKEIPPKLQIVTRTAELQQIILNLLLNARAAVLAKGRGQLISVWAGHSDGLTLIRVQDTGVGIAAGNLRKIFHPFFTTKVGHGTGLGLAVCRQIARSLGGRITVRSQLGKGTVFTVALPDVKPKSRKVKAES